MKTLSVSAAFAPRCMSIAVQVIGMDALQRSNLTRARRFGETCAGVGTSAFAIQLLRNNAAEHGVAVQLTPAFATEKNDRCRDVLEVVNACRHGHLYKDVTCRVPYVNCPIGAPFPYMLGSVMRGMFCRSMWCHKHQQMCQHDDIDVLIAGIPCIDFSKTGTRRQLEGPTARVIATVFRELVELQPSIAVIENVEQFPMAIVGEVVGHMYDIVDLNICPADAGYRLMARKRLYLVLVHRGKCSITMNINTLFDIMAAHNRHGDRSAPRHAILASSAEWHQELLEKLALRGLQMAGVGIPPAGHALLSREMQAILYFDEQHRQQEGGVPSWLNPDLIGFLGDNPWWRLTWSKVSMAIPTYRMNPGLMWSFCAGRWLTDAERLATMGWPAYEVLRRIMRAPDIAPHISDVARELGNTMHLGCIYMAMLLALSCTAPRV